MKNNNSDHLPPGFRFHPTDEELIMYYLRNQANSRPCPVSIIPEVDIYKFDPWELPEKTEFGENEWYFFTPRDRKYPNGVRPNRAAVSGYWKATGTDKSIYSGSKYVGVKKALVFYKGRPPKGIKTDWIMHEYRLINSSDHHHQSRSRSPPPPPPTRQYASMRLDDWVLCRIYKKKNNLAKNLDMIKAEILVEEEDHHHDHDQMRMVTVTDDHDHRDDDDDENGERTVIHHHLQQQQQYEYFPRTCSLSHLWELEYNMGGTAAATSISQIFGENNYNYNPVVFHEHHLQNTMLMMNNNSNNNNNNESSNLIIPRQLGDVGNHHHQYSDAIKFPVFEF